jgi:hypothetical protein
VTPRSLGEIFQSFRETLYFLLQVGIWEQLFIFSTYVTTPYYTVSLPRESILQVNAVLVESIELLHVDRQREEDI